MMYQTRPWLYSLVLLPGERTERKIESSWRRKVGFDLSVANVAGAKRQGHKSL
jgi:hypothetical protein